MTIRIKGIGEPAPTAMLGYSYIHNASLDQLTSWWISPETIPEDFGEHGLDEVAYGLSQHRPEGVQLLRDELRSKEPERRWASLYFLATPDLADDQLRQALVDSFDPANPRISDTVLRCCVDIAYFPFDEQKIRKLWRHPDDRFAATSMAYLAHSLPDQTEVILSLALKDSNPRMREYACDEIGDHNLAALSPLLEPLLKDPHPDVAASAASNLEFFVDH